MNPLQQWLPTFRSRYTGGSLKPLWRRASSGLSITIKAPWEQWMDSESETLECFYFEMGSGSVSLQNKQRKLSFTSVLMFMWWIYVANINGCKNVCMRFKIKSLQRFCWQNPFFCLRSFFHCEIFAGAEEAQLHTVSYFYNTSIIYLSTEDYFYTRK